jgi:hypothetical protein
MIKVKKSLHLAADLHFDDLLFPTSLRRWESIVNQFGVSTA